jgi:TRAP-type C4-dicarboxylate transport system permease large subunit
MPVMIIGGILRGIFTATEAGMEGYLLSFHYSQNAISGALKDLEYNTMEITNGMARRDGSGGWQKR